MTVDARGLSMTGSGEAAQRYDQAIDHLIRFHPQVVDAGAAAVAVDQDCVLAKVFCAYLALMSTEEGAVAEARDALGGLHADDAGAVLLPRERAHVAAAERWIDGDMSGAGDLLGAISVEYPRDLLALSVGHQIDFFTGDAVTLRDRIGRAIGGWRPDDSQLGFVQGMYAFGLEETNLYGQSEEVGQAAVERNPDDVWGIHAVVHTYEMAGRVPDGVRFMRSREADWQRGNFLNVHNSWHYAAVPAPGRRHRRRAGDVRPDDQARRITGRSTRARRRFGPALADAPGRHAGRRSLAAAVSGVGARTQARVLPVQRHARGDVVHRQRRARERRGPRP